MLLSCSVEGICQDTLDSGLYEIGIYMGAVPNPGISVYQPARLITGGSYDTPSRLIVEEVRLDTAIDTSK